jgi:hypothetical protein
MKLFCDFSITSSVNICSRSYSLCVQIFQQIYSNLCYGLKIFNNRSDFFASRSVDWIVNQIAALM